MFFPCPTLALRRLYDELINHIGGLTALHVPTTSYGSMLIHILPRTFPQDIIVDYHRKKAHKRTPSAATRTDSAEERLQNLLSFLRIEIESCEECDAIPEISPRRHDLQAQLNTPPNKRQVPTISVIQNSDNSGKVSCCCCNDTDHRAELHVSCLRRPLFFAVKDNAFVARRKNIELQAVAGELFVDSATNITLPTLLFGVS